MVNKQTDINQKTNRQIENYSNPYFLLALPLLLCKNRVLLGGYDEQG